MIEAVGGNGKAGEDKCFKMVGFESMDEMVGRADVLDNVVTGWHVQRWRLRWILPEVLANRRRPKAEADPHDGGAEGLLMGYHPT